MSFIWYLVLIYLYYNHLYIYDFSPFKRVNIGNSDQDGGVGDVELTTPQQRIKHTSTCGTILTES